MSDNLELESLAERCEAATSGDRELDCLIEIECGPDGPVIREIMAGSPHNTIDAVSRAADREGQALFFRVPRYTTSLDAAMSLVPEGHDTQVYLFFGRNGEGSAIVTPLKRIGLPRIFAATPALALCAAALKARSLTVEDSRG